MEISIVVGNKHRTLLGGVSVVPFLSFAHISAGGGCNKRRTVFKHRNISAGGGCNKISRCAGHLVKKSYRMNNVAVFDPERTRHDGSREALVQ